MSGMESLISKEFKVLLLLYDTRIMGNMVNYRQIDVAKELDVARNTIGTIYKNLTDMGYLDSASDKYYITKEGLKLCEEFKKINETTKVLMYCTKCGKPITEEWDYCQNCGNPLLKNQGIEKQNVVTEDNKENTKDKLNTVIQGELEEIGNIKEKREEYFKMGDIIKEFDKNRTDEEMLKYNKIKEMVDFEEKYGLRFNSIEEYEEKYQNIKDNKELDKVVETRNNILEYREGTEKIKNKKEYNVSEIILDRYMERKKKNFVGSATMDIYNRNGFVINVPSGCNYLVNFLLAYQNYLKLSKFLKCKILFLNSKSQYMIDKFAAAEGFTEFEVNSSMPLEEVIEKYSDKDILYNGEESASLLSMYMLLNIPADIYIIVEYNMEKYLDNLLTGKYLTNLWAVNSISDINLLGLEPEETIISTKGFSSNIIIPYIKNYGYDKFKTVGTAERFIKYFEVCHNTAYKKLDKFLDILED